MLRFLAAFIVLFAGAAAVVSLIPNPPKIAATRSAAAAPLNEAVQPAVDHTPVRVVYPASGSTVSTATQAAAVTPPPAPVATPAVPATAVASVYPQNPSAAPTAIDPVGPSEAAAQAGTQNININTASIEILNQIPGAGHIGRTIASHRPYRSVEDLLAKRVVRKAVYDRIKAQIAAE